MTPDAPDRIGALLQGAIDTHVHAAPDVVPRRLDDLELAADARAAGLRGVVLKSHHGGTAERAYLLSRLYPDVEVVGSITLNEPVGGLNARAVETALALGARVVWMPTKDAANHREHFGQRGGLTISDGSTIRREVLDILRLILAADAVLATGHLSPSESVALIDAALALGIRRICVTHPEWGVTAMSIEQQRRLAPTGCVWFERCLVSIAPDLRAHVTFDTIVEQIRAVGIDSTLLATDYGMPQYATPVEGLRDYVSRLIHAGFTDDEVRSMVRDNAMRLLRLGVARPATAPARSA